MVVLHGLRRGGTANGLDDQCSDVASYEYDGIWKITVSHEQTAAIEYTYTTSDSDGCIAVPSA